MSCTLISLLYGCMYIIRFGTMRKTYKEARTTRTGIWWNVWVLLAMPATWLAWSMILYVVCIISFGWRTGTADDANKGPMAPDKALAARIVVEALLSLGIIYFVLITATLRRHGEMMERAWHQRILGWVGDTVKDAYARTPPLVAPYTSAYHRPRTATSPDPPVPSSPGPSASQLGVRDAEAPAKADLGRSISVLFTANKTTTHDIPCEMSTVSGPTVADGHGATAGQWSSHFKLDPCG
ncbi:hypothetical protein BDZ97DRAFT_890863 [Flammula alnicola]|nr:hypothetical protein BDZ97DRAFT_890863 [Flammula alnicola]